MAFAASRAGGCTGAGCGGGLAAREGDRAGCCCGDDAQFGAVLDALDCLVHRSRQKAGAAREFRPAGGTG